MAHHEPIGRHKLAGTREIPDKLYFRIGEVAQLCEVPAYVLRFWESEFPQLKPNKGGTGQRLYRRRDVEMALRIKTLLYDQGYTISGARQVFKSEPKQKEPQVAPGVDETVQKANRERLLRLRREMQELLAMVSKPMAAGPVQPGSVQPIRMPRAPRLVAEKDPGTERLFDQPLMFPDA